MEKTQLLITVDETGRVQLSGPIDNKLLSYGLLEVARDALVEYHRTKTARIQPVSSLPEFVKQ